MVFDDNIQHISIEVGIQQLISASMAYSYKILPKQVGADYIEFFIDNKFYETNNEISDELELVLGKNIILIPIESAIIEKSLLVYYRKNIEGESVIGAESNDFLEELVVEAQNSKASDIHIEVYELEARVRIRIDGILVETRKIDKEKYLELINKIKIKANLDITEKRLPQDGRITYDKFDIRVSVLPTQFGEKVVMRLLGKDASNLSLESLGIQKENLSVYMDAIMKPTGIVLISGPTGSGKTTTLYATLKYLNTIERNIVTVEDPVEYTLSGINQVQLKENIGLSFSSALRSFLRQDPDVIMLGEIRDSETAKMAVRASLTGHLVLSTIHTNSSLGTISRLIDMGVPAFLLAETISLSVAQRLVRLLCDHCKEAVSISLKDIPETFRDFVEDNTCYKSKGCPKCYYTGYKGRKAIYEMLPVTYVVSEAIKKGTNLESGLDLRIERLSDKAFELFIKGKTSLEEIYPLLTNA